jgi:ABC-type uncharacterized transport system permease subunit
MIKVYTLVWVNVSNALKYVVLYCFSFLNIHSHSNFPVIINDYHQLNYYWRSFTYYEFYGMKLTYLYYKSTEDNK